MNKFCNDFSARVVIAVILTAALYGLWWVHNDHPLLAAGCAAVGILLYDWVLWWTRLLAWDKLRELDKNQKRLLSRLEKDEQAIEELTADEDDSTWG